MPSMTDLADKLLTIGAGGLSLVVMLWILVYVVTKINPSLNELSTKVDLTLDNVEDTRDEIKELIDITTNYYKNFNDSLSFLVQISNLTKEDLRDIQKIQKRNESILNLLQERTTTMGDSLLSISGVMHKLEIDSTKLSSIDSRAQRIEVDVIKIKERTARPKED